MQQSTELSLDPADWEEFSRIAHDALEASIKHIRTASKTPWRTLPKSARDDIHRPLPHAPGDLEEIVERVKKSILPFPTGNAHPRFWGWVMGNGTPAAMLADMMASAMNPHVGGYDQSASAVEGQVIDWCIEMMGYPAAASGLLVSGGTMANLTGLTVARYVKAGFDIRSRGLSGGPRLRVYGSTETHAWAEKCCELLGLGREGFRRVAADSQGRVDLGALREAVKEDRRRGDRPICIVGNAGTVDIGAIDDLDRLADVCRDEELWFHVDGAFGALANLSPSLQGRLKGLQRSDSLAFDLHKWGYLPYEIGCALVRDHKAHLSTFRSHPTYLQSQGRGIQPQPLEFADLGIQLSRGFRALKVWVSLQTYGTDTIGRVIEQNVGQAQYLATRIEAEPRLELMAPVALNIVCFRFHAPGVAEGPLEAINQEILVRLQEDGVAVPSSTRRNGSFALRVAITNHRSRQSDFDILVDAVLSYGEALMDHEH